MSNTFVYLNVNPKNKLIGDCVIRALSRALKQTWEKTFDELTEIARDECALVNDDTVWKRYLTEKGFTYHSYKPKKVEKRIKVNRFRCEPNKIYILSVARHLTVLKDWMYYDTWDCGERAVYSYYEIEDNNDYKVEWKDTLDVPDNDTDVIVRDVEKGTYCFGKFVNGGLVIRDKNSFSLSQEWTYADRASLGLLDWKDALLHDDELMEDKKYLISSVNLLKHKNGRAKSETFHIGEWNGVNAFLSGNDSKLKMHSISNYYNGVKFVEFG